MWHRNPFFINYTQFILLFWKRSNTQWRSINYAVDINKNNINLSQYYNDNAFTLIARSNFDLCQAHIVVALLLKTNLSWWQLLHHHSNSNVMWTLMWILSLLVLVIIPSMWLDLNYGIHCQFTWSVVGAYQCSNRL